MDFFRKRVVHFILREFLKNSNDSEWGSPRFAQSKSKTNQAHFINIFINSKTQIKVKPYTMPKINERLLKFEFFIML